MSNKNKKISKRINAIYEILDKETPKKIIFLSAEQPWQFLILVILTAQCTDKKVMNQKDVLFTRFPTLNDLANADISEIEQSIKTLGLYKVKAKNIKATAKILMEKYNGMVPENFEDLLTLPGVGRKTANCIRGEVFNLPAIICDTHFIRLMNRLGIVATTEAERVEKIISDNLSSDKQYRFSMASNYFARNFCKAISPKCKTCECKLKKWCKENIA